ncbi:MAG: hypothetical protein U9R08_05625, partial [Nanoarchaeota archaeon]|nr:hypothetical protein [Nanoarchaeota archaeon]
RSLTDITEKAKKPQTDQYKKDNKKLKARIHIAKKDFGWTDEEYRNYLEQTSNRTSTTEMTNEQMERTLQIWSVLDKKKKEYKPKPKKVRTEKNYIKEIKAGKSPEVKGKLSAKNKADIKADIERLDSKRKGKEKTVLTKADRHWNDFIDNAETVERETGIDGIYETAKNIEFNTKRVGHITTKEYNEFKQRFKHITNKFKDDAYYDKVNTELAEYFVNGKEIEDPEIRELAQWLKRLQDTTTPIIKEHRIRLFFEGRLSLNSFGNPKQKKFLKEWNEKLGKYEDNKEAYEKFFKDIEDGKIAGANVFIRKNYLAEDLENMLKNLPEKDLLASVKEDEIEVGKSFLKSKKRQGKGKEDVIDKVFRTYRKALRLKHLDSPTNSIDRKFKQGLNKESYNEIRTQLLRILGHRQPLSQVQKSIKHMMGMAYTIGVAVKGSIQVKNIFQRLLGIENFSDYAKIMKDIKSLKKKYGDEFYERFRNEMTEREGIRELSALDTTHDLTKFKDIAKRETSKVAWAIDRLIANPVMLFTHRTVGSFAANVQGHLDLKNRANGVLVWLDRTSKIMNRENLSWKQKKGRLGFHNLSNIEQSFLEKVLLEHGEGEFAYQLAKMKTVKSQFEYTRTLRNTWVNKENLLTDVFWQYNTWYRGFQKKVVTQVKSAMRKGDTVKSMKTLALITVNGMIARVMLDMITGTLSGDDDDPIEERIKNSALEYFNPFSYGGTWSAGTMLAPVSSYGIKQALEGDTYNAQLFSYGQVGELLKDISEMIGYSLAYPMVNDKTKKKFKRNISYNLDRNLRTTLLGYQWVANYYESVNDYRRVNLIRSLIDEKYKPKEYERN